MNATIYEVDSSHVPMLSNPEFVLDVVRTAKGGVGNGPRVHVSRSERGSSRGSSLRSGPPSGRPRSIEANVGEGGNGGRNRPAFDA
jgi:hypothetical protein